MTNQSGNNMISYTTINSDITCVKYYNNMFLSSEYQIGATIAYNPDYTEEEINFEVNKLKYWLEETLTDCLIVDATDEMGAKIGLLSTNSLLHCPGVPDDALIAHILQRKCRAITSSALTFLSFKLTGSDTNTTTHFAADELPDSDVLPNDPSYAAISVYGDAPWWKRPDGFCYEFMELEGKTFEEAYGDITEFDILTEFEESYNIVNDLNSEATETEVLKPSISSWKPKKV